MGNSGYIFSTQSEQALYYKLLKISGALSKLFTESKDVYLHYRIMENAFCKAFNAENLSRSDLSVDVSKTGVGLGLKTFLHRNGSPMEKIAEFNRSSYLLKDLSPREMIHKIAEMRNERIRSTKDICNLTDVGYHYITRKEHQLLIFEEPMAIIDVSSLKLKKSDNTSIKFSDNLNEYSFSLSKHTLFRRFDVSKAKLVDSLYIRILDDPFEFLTSLDATIIDATKVEEEPVFEDYIILPLYSPRDNKVQEKSGLNMWNAGGRPRNVDEVYIPVPAWIHKEKVDFFDYDLGRYPNTNSFTVNLPNRKTLQMKVTQAGGKALQSDPNKDLGKWLLRDVLRLSPGTLVTKQMLDEIGIDSVKLSKVKSGLFHLDFLKTGSFEDYKSEHFSDFEDEE